MKSIETGTYRLAFWNRMKGDLPENYEPDVYDQTSDGGYVLPTSTEARFEKEQGRNNIFRTLATVLYTDTTNKVKVLIPAGDAAFVEESGIIPEATANLREWTVSPHKVAKMTKVSNEMRRDAGFDLEAALAADFGRAFSSVEEKGIITGSGRGEPFGLLHPTAGAETGATSAAAIITTDDIRKLYFSLDRKYRREAVWVMSDETALLLRTLKDNAGNYLWHESTQTLLGKPVYTSPYMPDVAGGEKPVLFGDFSYYWLVQRGAVTLSPLHELFAENGITAYIGMEFIDGKLIWRNAVKALVVKE